MAFFTKKKPVEPPVETNTRLARGSRVEGDLTTSRTVALAGDFKGSIKTGKELTVENGAIFSGEATSSTLSLLGNAEGEFTCETARFLPGCRWKGTLKASRLEIRKGAALAGEIKENLKK